MVSRVSSWVGVAALAFGAALSGCGSAGSKSAPAGAVTEKGQHGVYFLVSLPKPTGGTIRSSDGQIACGSAGTACGPARYDWTATATLTAQADAGYTFFGWAGDCGGQGSCSVSNAYFAADKTIAAVFTNGTSWNVAVVKVGTGGGSVSATVAGQSLGSCNASLSKCDIQVPISNPPAQVTLTALPDLSSHFGGWSGGLCSGKAPCTIEVDRAKSVVADFEPGPESYPVGGTVTGLIGSGLVLKDNGGDDLLLVSSGNFTFSTPVAIGATYAVTVATQPTNPSQTCTVSGGNGTIGNGPVTGVTVTCTTDTYALGGSVSGLAGSGLVVATAGEAPLPVAPGATSFTFPTPLASGTGYAVSVSQQPSSPWQTCVVGNATGTITSAPVTSVSVSCTTNQYAIGGAVGGLSGSGLVLAASGEPNLSVSAGASSFTFANTVASGASYAVSIVQQPTNPSQTCVVSNGSGTVGGGPVTSVSVSCTTNQYALGGTVSGLAGTGLVLAAAGEPNLSVSAGASSFTFANTVASGASYAVSIAQQPTNPSQTCVVSNGSGTVGSGPVTSVSVSCTTNQYALGGTVSGLAGAGLVLAASGQPNLSISAGASSFTFANTVGSGSSYSVSIAQQPTNPSQTCVVSNGSGTVGGGPVTSVSVSCTTNQYALGGTVSGLAGSGLVLAAAGEPNLSVSAGASSFTFANTVASGASYSVSISQQPTNPSQTCVVSNGSGNVGGGPVTSVAVSCTTNRYAVGGTISGLASTGLVLAATGLPNLNVPSGATGFTFAGTIASGSSYTVTVAQQPSTPPQYCYVTNGTGSVVAADVTSVAVTCSADWSSVVSGPNADYTLGLRPDGTLWAWGYNAFGQFGDGTTTSRNAPVLVGSGFSSVAAGAYHVVALKADGSLWTWGYNYYGQLGDGTTSQRSTPRQIGTGFQAVAVGIYHSVAVKTDGSLWAWGYNYYGQVGDGTTTDRWSPVQIGTGYATACAGPWSSAAIRPDGTLMTWGYNGNGVLGDGTTTNRLSPTQIGTGFAAVGMTGNNTVAIKTGGTLWTWGYGGYGTNGDGFTTRYSPAQVGTGFTAIATGNTHVVALKTDGTLWSWGSNTYGQLGEGTTSVRSTPVQIGAGYARIAAGNNHSAAVRTDGTLWAWGYNGYGQLGDGTIAQRANPFQVGTGFTFVACGRNHVAAIKADGSLWTWGFNSYGQLGDGTTMHRMAPVQVGTGFASVSAGYGHTLAVKTDGTLWAWGSNGQGQLGTGNFTASLVPVMIGTGFASASAGDSHSLAVKVDGTLLAWGYNYYGQVGNGSSGTNVPSPVAIGSGFRAASAGYLHSLAVRSDDTLWSWGWNYYGQLGNGSSGTNVLSPVQVGIGYRTAAAGYYHGLGLKTDGTVWGWGLNNGGAIGVGSGGTNILSPAQVGAGFTAIATSLARSAGLKADGSLWTWGSGSYGELWNGTPYGTFYNPTQVATGFAMVAYGDAFSAGIKSDGSLLTVGSNAYGQLGDGSRIVVYLPELVP